MPDPALRPSVALPAAPLPARFPRLRLLGRLVVWDLFALYFGSVGGFVWNLVLPAIVVAAYLLVFELTPGFRFGGRETVGGFGLNLVAGLIPWLLFQEAVTRAATCFVDSRHVLTQLPLPKGLFPLAQVGSALVRHVFALLLFVGILLWTGVPPGRLALLLPLPMALMLLLAAGAATLVASLHVFARDVGPTVTAAMLPLFFATPVIYPPHVVPKALRLVMDLNPLAPVVIAYRDLLVTGRMVDAPALGYSAVFSVLLGGIAALVLRRAARELPERV
jgi:ABC-type polysaccharide/polyol phosphate export permease